MDLAIHIEATRAAFARAAWIRGQSPAYDEDAVIDLLAGIRLWCQHTGISYDRCDQMAYVFYIDNGSAS